MKLHNIYSLNKTAAYAAAGFTLIEIIVTLAMFSAILGLGAFFTFDSYRGYSFRSEQSVIVSVLEKARSRSMSNIYQTSWSVCYDAGSKNYVLFRGLTYSSGAGTNEPVQANSAVTLSGFPACGVSSLGFEQLTGKLIPQQSPLSAVLTITTTQDARTSAVTINNEGRINW